MQIKWHVSRTVLENGPFDCSENRVKIYLLFFTSETLDFKSDVNLRATFQNYFGDRPFDCGENRVKIYVLFFTSETLDFVSAQS